MYHWLNISLSESDQDRTQSFPVESTISYEFMSQIRLNLLCVFLSFLHLPLPLADLRAPTLPRVTTLTDGFLRLPAWNAEQLRPQE